MARFSLPWTNLQTHINDRLQHPDNWALRNHQYIILSVIAVLSTLIVYIPFLMDGTMDYVYRYWDGPNYVYLAKSLYNIPVDHPLSAYTTPQYFAAHLPVYPFTIRLFSFMGYLNAMLFTTVLYGALAAMVFYKLLLETKAVRSPLWSAIISMFIPARYLIYHSTGATEAPFIFFTLWSMLAYVRGQYILCFALAGISGITRITGILIGGAYFMMLVTEKKWKQIPFLALVGAPLFLTFVFYHFHYGDFFAYFGTNYSASNKLISLRPLDLFRAYSQNGDTHSAEFYLIMYALYGTGTALLWSRNKLFFWFCLISFIFSIFIYHQDVSRYLIPMAPLALVVAYDDILSRRALMVAFVPVLIIVYIYTWGMIPRNMIDAHNFRKLETALEKEHKAPELKVNFTDLHIQACSYHNCDSSIRSKKSNNKLKAERGLNLYAYYDDGTISLLKNYDHCSQSKIYAMNDPLKSYISSLKKRPSKIVLLSSDTIVCDMKKLPGAKRWSQGYALREFNRIDFRDTYIAIIDLNTNQIEEHRAKETIRLP